MQTHKTGFKADDLLPARTLDVTFAGLVSAMPEHFERDPIMRAAYDGLAIAAQTRVRNMMRERTADGSAWLHDDAAVLAYASQLTVDDVSGDGRSGRLSPEDKAVRFVVDVNMTPADAAALVANVTDAAIEAEKSRRAEAASKDKQANGGKTANKAKARKAS